jgi:hypothetical protein
LRFPLVQAKPTTCATQAGSSLRTYECLGPFAQHACQACPIKSYYTTAERRWITRLEHMDGLEAAQRWLNENPAAMRQ